MNSKVKFDEVMAEVEALEYKYRSLVWYSRKPPYEFIEEEFKKKGTPQETIEKCMESKLKYQKEFPKETSQLSGVHGDWHHGFNSGCLAAFRFVYTALDTSTTTDEDGIEFNLGGLEIAKEWFPDLDT